MLAHETVGAHHRETTPEGMFIEWDVPIEMDDRLVLRADLYRPDGDGRYPVVLSHGPYGKGLSFQEGYSTSWEIMVKNHPDVTAGSTNRFQSWEVVDPEKWVPEGYMPKPMTGVGPFVHNDLSDRPPEVFDSTVTVHTGGATPSSLLVPLIPAS